MADSYLRIERPGLAPVAFPLRSNRGVSQSIKPYFSGGLVETVDGGHRNGVRQLSRKFRTEVSCDDFHAPGFAGLWPGDVVTIHCAKPITQSLAAPSANATLIRDPAAGPIMGIAAASGRLVAATGLNGRQAAFGQTVTGVRFHPILTCLIEDWDDAGEEWEALANWSFSGIEQRGY